jgi:hypothetical protein
LWTEYFLTNMSTWRRLHLGAYMVSNPYNCDIMHTDATVNQANLPSGIFTTEAEMLMLEVDHTIANICSRWFREWDHIGQHRLMVVFAAFVCNIKLPFGRRMFPHCFLCFLFLFLFCEITASCIRCLNQVTSKHAELHSSVPVKLHSNMITLSFLIKFQVLSTSSTKYY